LQLSEVRVIGKTVEEVPEYRPTLVKVLNIVAVIFAFCVILVIYLPNSIWKEEDAVRAVSRKRMVVMNEVEKFYKQMVGVYQNDPLLAMKVITAVRDSTRADSNYFGEQVVKLPEGKFTLMVPKNFFLTFDTTFALGYQKKDTIYDTTYRVLKWNEEMLTNDTVYVLADRYRELQKADSSFRKALDSETSTRVQINRYYRPFYLDTTFAYSPLINELYQITSDTSKVKIQDPLKGVFKEKRYLFFAFKDTSAGYIENDEKSWKD